MKKNIYKSLSYALGLSLVFAQPALAQKDTTSYSLKEAVEYAKKNSYTLQNSQLDEADYKAKVKETLAIGLPQVNGSVSFNKNFQLQPFYFAMDFSMLGMANYPLYKELYDNGSISQATYNGLVNPSPMAPAVTRAGAPVTGNAGITATQLIFDGSYLVGVRASKEFVKLSQKLTEKASQDIEISVSKSYYQALIAQENIALVESNLQQLEKTLRDTRAIHASGFAERTDVERLELSVSNLQLQKERLENQREIMQKLLKMQMGLPVSQGIRLSDKLENLYQANAQLTEKGTPNASSRIEYQLLDQQVKLNQLNLKRYNIGSLPSIAAVYNFSESSFLDNKFKTLTPGGTWYASSFVGLRMDVPIFDGLRKRALKQQSNIAIKKLDNDKKNFENAVNMETYQAQSTYEMAVKQVEIRKNNMKLADNIYVAVSAKYKNGVGSSFELTQAETDVKSAQVSYLSAVYEVLVARIELNKALGKTILN